MPFVQPRRRWLLLIYSAAALVLLDGARGCGV